MVFNEAFVGCLVVWLFGCLGVMMFWTVGWLVFFFVEVTGTCHTGDTTRAIVLVLIISSLVL